MSKEAFISELEDTLDILEKGTCHPETVFREIPGWDSLAALTLLAVFDTVFGQQLSGEELAQCHTIQDVIDRANQPR